MLQGKLHYLLLHGLGNMVPELAWIRTPVDQPIFPFLLVLSVPAVEGASGYVHDDLMKAITKASCVNAGMSVTEVCNVSL